MFIFTNRGSCCRKAPGHFGICLGIDSLLKYVVILTSISNCSIANWKYS